MIKILNCEFCVVCARVSFFIIFVVVKKLAKIKAKKFWKRSRVLAPTYSHKRFPLFTRPRTLREAQKKLDPR